jgi:hypothetical protein
MNTHKFQLGQQLRDLVTSFTGIAVSRIEYLNGCIQYGVKPKVDEKGAMPEVQYIDQHQLEATGESISIEKDDTGGDMPDCPKH